MQPNRTRRWLATAAVAVGLAAGAAGVASAATNASSSSSTTAPSASSTQQKQPPPPGDPAKMDHGPGETLLTGDTAAKVTAAAKAAIPDGTIIRVETDAQGSPYEAHVQKADGSNVTLKIDSSFKVTSTENGFGGGPGGHGGPGGPGGPPPNGAAPNGNGSGSGYGAPPAGYSAQ